MPALLRIIFPFFEKNAYLKLQFDSIVHMLIWWEITDQRKEQEGNESL